MSNAHSRSFPSTHAFLIFQEPQVIAPEEPNPPEEKSLEWLKYWLFRTSDLRFIPDPRLVDYVAEYKRCKRKESVPWKNTQAFMDILLPTRYWTEHGIRYKQNVSTDQVTREELKATNQRLDQQLKYRQSQPNTEYCPIRFQLHVELFDELIRQVALNSPMRAYMLERVRGELNQTLDAYKTVLDISLIEESKLAVQDRIDPEVMLMQRKLSEVQTELAITTEQHSNANSDYKELLNKLDLFERIQRQVHEPEIAFTKRLNDALVRQLYHFDNPPTFDTGGEDEE